MAEPAEAQLLQMLLMQAENPDIETRDQYREQIDNPDNPGVAPGWNALMVQDVVAGMFIMGATEQAEGQEPEETPGSPITNSRNSPPASPRPSGKGLPGTSRRTSSTGRSTKRSGRWREGP